MSLINVHDLHRHFQAEFPSIEDVTAALKAAKLEPRTCDAFDRWNDQYWLADACDVLMDAIEERSDAERGDAIEKLHETANELRSARAAGEIYIGGNSYFGKVVEDSPAATEASAANGYRCKAHVSDPNQGPVSFT